MVKLANEGKEDTKKQAKAESNQEKLLHNQKRLRELDTQLGHAVPQLDTEISSAWRGRGRGGRRAPRRVCRRGPVCDDASLLLLCMHAAPLPQPAPLLRATPYPTHPPTHL